MAIPRQTTLLSRTAKFWRPIIFLLFGIQGLVLLSIRLSAAGGKFSNLNLHGWKRNAENSGNDSFVQQSVKAVSNGAIKGAHNERSEADAFVRSISWTAPFGKGVEMCEAWLAENDKTSPLRDFNKDPIVVAGSEEKTWQECDVPCHHTSRSGGDFDGAFGYMGVSETTNSILRSMEPRSYYSSNDVEKATKTGVSVVMTVHLNSHVPVGYFSWEEYDIMSPIPPKNSTVGHAVAFISNCHANNFRAEAVTKLQQWIKVDSYGSCVNNMPHTGDKMGAISKYKFCLAFENSCEDDYSTEKFWQSLVAGCVPVVIGPPNIAQFVPSNASYIHFQSLEQTEEIARRIKRVSGNESEWLEMMAWKEKGPSDMFKALVDMSAVHSSCRLCIHLADKWVARDEQKHIRQKPCRCQSKNGDTIFHVFVRERGRFFFSSVYLSSSELTLATLESKTVKQFESERLVPVWKTKRPKVLVNESDSSLRVYHIYPYNSNQREALYGKGWFRNTAQFRDHLRGNPCPKLEIIFV